MILPVMMVGGGVMLVYAAFTGQHPWTPVVEAFGGAPLPEPGGAVSTMSAPAPVGPAPIIGGVSGANRYGAQVIARAQSLVGVGPYRLGGTSTTGGGLDCSWVSHLCYLPELNLPHSAALQYATGVKLSRAELSPGDLIAMPLGESGGIIHHVAVYMGGGQTVEAAPSHGGVGIAPLGYQPGPYFYFRPRGA